VRLSQIFRKSQVRAFFLVLAGWVACAPAVAFAQVQGGAEEVQVIVRSARGETLTQRVQVTIRSLGSSLVMYEFTQGDGQAVFRNVLEGYYRAEVNVPGYEPASEEFQIDPATPITRIFIYLKPIGSETMTSTPARIQPLVLAPKARKEVEKAQEALNKKNFEEAERRILRALQLAPGHPFVNYLAGLLYFQQNQIEKALPYLEKATMLDPHHAPSHMLLGMVLFRSQKFAGAVAALERALALDPSPWQAHWAIAQSYFREGNYEKAALHAQRARELAKGPAPDFSLVLGMSLAYLGENDRAIAELEAFLSRGTNRPGAPEARQTLALLRSGPNVRVLPPDSSPAPVAAPESSVEVVPVGLLGENWAPLDVDEVRPTVDANVTCSLPDVLKQTSERAAAVLSNLEKIGAKEIIDLYDMDPQGGAKLRTSHTFDYVVGFKHAREKRYMFVEESRLGRVDSDPLVTRTYTHGLTALVLVFHPYYIDDFDMACEGLGQWRGEPAWIVTFRQRPDKPSRLHSYTIQQNQFPVDLKGRAWIAANSYQFLRIETDMMKPVPEIELRREHLVVEYKPVDFPNQKLRLWLPSTAQVHMQRRGRRMRLDHSFSDFMLFLVDVRQDIKAPREQSVPQP
jgi:tetratricopeptide (TPR) repeat protein